MSIIAPGKVTPGTGLGTPLRSAGAPVDGTTYAGVIAVGGILIDTTNAKLYQNTGTVAAPVFTKVGLET